MVVVVMMMMMMMMMMVVVVAMIPLNETISIWSLIERLLDLTCSVRLHWLFDVCVIQMSIFNSNFYYRLLLSSDLNLFESKQIFAVGDARTENK